MKESVPANPCAATLQGGGHVPLRERLCARESVFRCKHQCPQHLRPMGPPVLDSRVPHQIVALKCRPATTRWLHTPQLRGVGGGHSGDIFSFLADFRLRSRRSSL